MYLTEFSAPPEIVFSLSFPFNFNMYQLDTSVQKYITFHLFSYQIQIPFSFPQTLHPCSRHSDSSCCYLTDAISAAVKKPLTSFQHVCACLQM